MSDLHDKIFPYDDMNVTVLKALARLPLSVNECEELMEMDTHILMVEHQLDYVQADTVRMWCQHEHQRHSAASVSGVGEKGAKSLRDMSKWQPSRTYPIKESAGQKLRRMIREEKAKLLETRDQSDQALSRYQASTYGDAYNDIEPKMEDAVFSAVDMFVEMNGVSEQEANQMVVDYVKDMLGVR